MIVLKSPKNSKTVDLHTDAQISFLKSDRSNVSLEDFDYLNLNMVEENDYSFPKELEFEWEADADGVLQISEDEDFSTFISLHGHNRAKVINLKCGTRYFWRVVCEDEVSDIFYFDTADRYPRFIKIDGITNVRDCGGRKTVSEKRVRQGLLYRGSELNSHITVTECGLKTMRDQLNIKSVLDLRGATEEVEDVYKGEYINIPVIPYGEWFSHPETARKVFEYIFDKNNYPLYFHCWGGADRTGTLAFLLGALLGESYESLIDDYEITTVSAIEVRSRNSKNQFIPFWNKFQSFEGDTLQEKAISYLLSIGISEAAIKDFQEFMLY